jgi:uncharacterized protein YneF (UPF0154 family)
MMRKPSPQFYVLLAGLFIFLAIGTWLARRYFKIGQDE